MTALLTGCAAILGLLSFRANWIGEREISGDIVQVAILIALLALCAK